MEASSKTQISKEMDLSHAKMMIIFLYYARTFVVHSTRYTKSYIYVLGPLL